MAADISSRVLNMVRRRILEDPSVTNDVLFAAATEMEPDVETLSMRQFNARYPLRVRRWELSERTRILQPSGPLSKAAAENPAAPIPTRSELSFAVSDNADGSTDSQLQDSAPQSQPRDGAPQSLTGVAPDPSRSEPPSNQPVGTPASAEEPFSRAEPRAPTVSQAATSRLEAPPRAQEQSAAPEPDTTSVVATLGSATRPPRRRRATRRPADDARAEVILIMLRWATAIGQASGIPEVFATLSTVDDYVDHIARVLDMP